LTEDGVIMNMLKNKERKGSEINNKQYYIYIHINKTNNKIYVETENTRDFSHGMNRCIC